MLKNALIFAIAALTIAFAAPSLLVGLGGRAAPGAPSAAVVAPAPSVERAVETPAKRS